MAALNSEMERPGQQVCCSQTEPRPAIPHPGSARPAIPRPAIPRPSEKSCESCETGPVALDPLGLEEVCVVDVLALPVELCCTELEPPEGSPVL